MVETLKAEVTYIDGVDGHELIRLDMHSLQFGGIGDGYCYGHQSFECMTTLSAEQWEAIRAL